MSNNNNPMEINIMDIQLMVKKMDLANISIKMEDIIKVILKIINQMAMENYIMINMYQHMMDNGIMVNFMDKVKYIMMLLNNYSNSLIIVNFNKIYKIVGHAIKVLILLILGELAHDTKVGFGKIYLSNGEFFEGIFNEDRVHGKGKFYSYRNGG